MAGKQRGKSVMSRKARKDLLKDLKIALKQLKGIREGLSGKGDAASAVLVSELDKVKQNFKDQVVDAVMEG